MDFKKIQTITIFLQFSRYACACASWVCGFMKYKSKYGNQLRNLFCGETIVTLLFALCTLSTNLFSQGLKINPLQYREHSIEIEQHNGRTIVAWEISDTLTLPFFEDFSEQFGFPSQNRWTDNQVWINNTFGVGAPNQQVATFDHLNEKGSPYTTLNKNSSVFADSLTSQPINLQFYKVGGTTYPYKLTDNLVLSFFYQAQGFGDIPEPEDSLVLFFKSKNDVWKRVWSAGGTATNDFQEVFVVVDDMDFLIPDFQFRWVNYTKATGNLNHWHIDYIRMDKKRQWNVSDIEDVGLSKLDPGIFRQFSNVPYSHFKNHPGQVFAGKSRLWVKNLNNSNTVQTRFYLSVSNSSGTKLFEQDFAQSARNILPLDDSMEYFEIPFIDTLSGTNPELNFKVVIDPRSNDNTPEYYDAQTNNNEIKSKHIFGPWYSYDDGSAEGGFGLDYAYLGNIKGQFAMEFNTLQGDSLKGISMYFTQTKEDVAYRSFKLRVWRKLSPIGGTDNQDELIYEFPVDHPVYRDSINHFHYFFFDSSIYLPAGQYYVGWMQTMPFVLNVGYDNNYRFNNSEGRNPYLFYNLLGSWEYADYSVKGTPMIRMLFGQSEDFLFNVSDVPKINIKIYPNPTSDFIHVNSDQPQLIDHYRICNAQGQTLRLSQMPTIGVYDLPNGVYYIHTYLKNGKLKSSSFIKN